MRALGAAHAPATSVTADNDRSIRGRLSAELQNQPWANRIWPQDIIVNGGIVHLWFTSDEPDETKDAARIAAENVPGVRGVEVHIAPSSLLPAY